MYDENKLFLNESKKLENFVRVVGGKYGEISLDLIAKCMGEDMQDTEIGPLPISHKGRQQEGGDGYNAYESENRQRF